REALAQVLGRVARLGLLLAVVRARGRALELLRARRGDVLVHVVGDRFEEAVAAQYRRLAPVQRALRARGVEDREPHGVCAVARARQPVAQVRDREYLLERLRARLDGDTNWNPQPQRVEVAVERVGLAARGAVAAGARRLHEVLALGERVAAARGRDVARQHD